MQIQSSVAVGAAASSVSQAASKDRSNSSSSEPATHAPTNTVEKVERSEQASADRDAQGGSWGRSDQQDAQPDDGIAGTSARATESLPVKPPEPPSLLDIVG